MRTLYLGLLTWFALGRPALADKAHATLAVRGPVTVHLELAAADLDVQVSQGREVSIDVDDAPRQGVELALRGPDRVEVTFGGRARLSSGDVHLRMPRGSHLEVATLSGDMRLRGTYGQVRARTLSGDIDMEAATGAELQTISGDVTLGAVSGAVRIKTVSGDAIVTATGTAPPQLEFESTSGDLRWSGLCGARCRVTAATVSGDLELLLDGKSSFELRFQSHSGDLGDRLGLSGLPPPRDRPGIDARGRFGGGAGVVEARTYSGDLQLRKR
jgi:hypothetical protein